MRGFTLVEILVVIAIIAVLAILALMAFNPTMQRIKIYDIKRKRDVNNLRSIYELFHSSKSRYPTGDELCYDAPVESGGVCSCHLCGLEKDTGALGPVLQVLYCDPEHPKSSYVYEYDCSDSPSWYRLYTHLGFDDKDQKPLTDASCRYGVTSKSDGFLEPYPDSCGGVNIEIPDNGDGGGGDNPPNTPTPTPPACADDPVPKYCVNSDICNICGNYANCLNPSTCDQPPVLFSNSLCTDQCQNFGNFGPTATPEPSPTPFQYGSCPADPTPKYCLIGSICNNCGAFQNCIQTCASPLTLYGNATCNGMCYSE